METKQIIIIRKDLNMRKGKIAAQACHASMAFITKFIYEFEWDSEHEHTNLVSYGHKNGDEIRDWLQNSFKKIVVYVNSEEELDELHQKCLNAGLVSHMIIDNGATEFHGVPTKTAIAIGPAYSNKFTGLTDHLPLL